MPRVSRRGAETTAPVITLLTDYGHSDIYVGVLHGVIGRICPEARVIDVTHAIPAGDVLAGALALADALPYLPVGIHVAVVDPGVGTERRALALRSLGGRVFIGPDNGVLSLALPIAGGADTAVELSESPMALDPISATFHGRDIFAAVAASLAGGRNFIEAGEIVEPEEMVVLELPEGEVSEGALLATVSAVDAFGNLALLAPPSMAAAAGLEPGGVITVSSHRRTMYARYGRTFGDVGAGRLVLYAASTQRLALAANRASAAEILGVGAGDQIRLAR